MPACIRPRRFVVQAFLSSILTNKHRLDKFWGCLLASAWRDFVRCRGSWAVRWAFLGGRPVSWLRSEVVKCWMKSGRCLCVPLLCTGLLAESNRCAQICTNPVLLGAGTEVGQVTPPAVEALWEMLWFFCPLPQMFSAGYVVTHPSAKWPFRRGDLTECAVHLLDFTVWSSSSDLNGNTMSVKLKGKGITDN